MRTVATNPFMEKVRAAYHKSAAYRALHGIAPLPGTVGAALPREPGSDDDKPLALGIPLDDLEQEFMDKAQP